MDHVGLHRVLHVSSEDPVHRAANLVDVHNVGLKWLSSKDLQSGKMEAVYSLERPSCIKSIYLCNFGSAMIEVLVKGDGDGDSSITLLPPKMLMTPQDSKKGLNRTANLTFTCDKLSQHAVDRKWTTVLVRCQQPFNRDDQFGLSSLILSSSPEGIPSNVCVDINIRHQPSSHGTSTNASVVTKSDVDESGPPLMKMAKAGLPLPPQGAVMQRLMEDRVQRHHRASATARLKQEPKRIHLLKRNIPKSLCTSDFMESYKSQPSKEDSLDFSRINRAVRIGSMLDNCELGGKGRYRPRCKQPVRSEISSGWLSTRKGIAGEVEGGSTQYEEGDGGDRKDTEDDKEAESYDCTSEEDAEVQCPLCWFFFPKSIIEIHCTTCEEDLTHFTSFVPRSHESDVIVLD